jgi:alanine transaminase
MINDSIADSDLISKDAREYIKKMKAEMTSPMGAYTSNSKGTSYVRKTVAKYIMERDGPAVESDWNNIFLTNGASEGVR